ncbi:MAG: BamA/TamA family outer membrane protein [Bacteroidetes bacterium]|nr:BamA/TamA family outer membrane protein [Bacteroidota bacterium]
MPGKNNILLKFFLFLMIISYSKSSIAQIKKNVRFELNDTTNTTLFNEELNSFDLSKKYTDTLQLKEDIGQFVEKIRSHGFLAASCDSIITKEESILIYFFLGERYLWTNVNPVNIDESFLSGTGIKNKKKKSIPFNYVKISSWMETILKNCENNGYPFANVRLTNVQQVNNEYAADLELNKNKLVRIDSIIIKGNATIAPVYIYNYIDIKEGSIYDESKLIRISTRLKELAFVTELKPNQLLFTENITKLYIYLDNKKASQFDGVIGFLPDENNEGKLNLTGEVHLKLQNSLQRGEVIEFNWKQLPNKTQDLKIHLLYPFLLNTPFGIDGNLSIYRRDSTYTDVIKNLGIQYSISGNNYLKAFINDKQSDLQSSKGLENITVLPDYADISILSYGATFHFEKLDYRLNPKKGYAVEFTGSTGNRKIKKNTDINPIAYDSLKLQSVTYEGAISADFYLSLGGKSVLNLGTKSGIVYNDRLFTNELFRIGGLKSLRGFDEESIYASTFSIGKIEYRFLLEQNSFLFAFINGAYYENKSRNFNLKDTPFGFGAGMNFETRIGIMSISYALGKQFSNPVYFRNAKVHFGIVNYF